MSEHGWRLWYSHHMRNRDDFYSRSLRFAIKLWHTLGLTHVALVLTLVAYALLGGLIFVAIEGPAERERQIQLTIEIDKKRREISQAMIEFIGNCTLHPDLKYCATGMEERIAWYERETEPLRVAQPGNYNWGNFWNAVWYASTVFTTIGYGNLSCKTFAGQLVTIFYALIGIPLTLVVLNDIGQLLFRKLSLAYNYFLRKTGRSKEDKSADSSEEETLPLWIAVAIILVYAFVFGAIFTIIEKEWTFFNGMYFMFISLCTIGFGDVMPSDPHDTLKMSVIFLIGLSLISLCLSIMNVSMEKRYRKTMEDMQATIEQDDRKINTGAFQSIIYAKRPDMQTYDKSGEHEAEGILSPTNNYPGITLGVISSQSQSRSRSPSPRRRTPGQDN